MNSNQRRWLQTSLLVFPLLTMGCGSGPDDTGGGTGGSEQGGGGSGAESNASGGSPAASTGGSTGTDPTKIYSSAKLDILFVVDDSISMLDKQEYLAQAVPGLLLEHLAEPPCLDAQGNVVQPVTDTCPDGTAPAHAPVTDIHVAVISTSIGSAGDSACADRNDKAHLLPRVRSGLHSDDALGFLKFTAGGDLGTFANHLQAHVAAAGAAGCGYEAPLEALYRFLVDPQPPLSIQVVAGKSVKTGVDEVVLEQRAAFLRPDSAVLTVLLSDENDCSVLDGVNYYAFGNQGWRMSDRTTELPVATEECATDPNDRCCYSCALDLPPSGCQDTCVSPPEKLEPSEDRPNLRCFDQKRRFGMDLLFPTERYIEALTKVRIPDTRAAECKIGECPLVDNPLFPEIDGKRRDPSMVIVLGIIGVPWQDVATAGSLGNGPSLSFLSPSSLQDEDRWKVILGDPATTVPPTDPFMRESIAERSGVNPIIGDPIVPSSSTNPRANAINGHESKYDVLRPGTEELANDDLQFACIFELPTPVVCDGELCDCAPALSNRNLALCQPPAGGSAGSTQYFAKAYPGLRQLEVLKGLGQSGLVASICPKNSKGSPTDPNYGYNPALQLAHRALWRALD